MSTLRDFRGIWGSLIFMGKNAHDYFLCVHDITGDPAKRAYFEAKAADIKVMGRANVLALARGRYPRAVRATAASSPTGKRGATASLRRAAAKWSRS